MRAALAAVLVATLPGTALATVPAGFTDTAYATIPNAPEVTSMAWAPDDSNRLFVTGKNGQIWIVKNGVLLAQTFYRFTPRAQQAGAELVTTSECGLLGIAFDPDFIDNQYVYVFATLFVPPDDHIEQQIIRLTANGDTGTGRVSIVTGLSSRGANHDGGGLAFGPDGYLYWAVGDNGNMTGVGTDLMSSAGKVGRAAPVPNAPPLPGQLNDGAGPNWDYTFARGVRNPYTMTFNPATGLLWVNVVGTDWEQTFVLSEGDHAGYPMENVEPGAGGYTTVSPVIGYWTHDLTAPPLLASGGATRSGNQVTFTTQVDHHVRKGWEIDVAGVATASFNGRFVVKSTPTTKTVVVDQAGNNETGNGGTLTPVDHGYVILGGTFYDATLFPAEHRLAFFFGDYGSGELVRAVTDGPKSISEVKKFGDNFGAHIDAATGPDGALYVIRHTGAIRRIGYDRTDLGVVVSPQNLRLAEGGQGVVGVRLTKPPGATVTVNLSISGDPDVTVSGGPFTFDDTSWETPQYAHLLSAVDADTVEDVAMMVASTGQTAETVTVRVTDQPVTPPPPPDAGVPDAPIPPDAALPDARIADAAVAVDGAAAADAAPTIDAPLGVDARPSPDARITAGDEEGGCDCRAGGTTSSFGWLALLALLCALRPRRAR